VINAAIMSAIRSWSLRLQFAGIHCGLRSAAASCLPFLLTILLICCCNEARAQETDLTIGLGSGVVIRGIASGREELSLQAMATYYATAGWHVGIGGTTVRSQAEPNQGVLLTGKLGYARPLSEDWSVQLGYSRYDYLLSASLRPFAHDELGASISYRDLVVLSISGLYNSRLSDGGGRASVAFDLTGRYPLSAEFSLAAGIGYQDLYRQSGFGYTYGHCGIGARMGSAHLDISYVITDSTAKAQFGTIASNRWTAGLTWNF